MVRQSTAMLTFMFSTVIVVATLLTLLAIYMVVWMALLRIGLRWARVADVTRRRLVVTLVSVLTAEVIVSVVLQFVMPASESQSLLLSGVGLAAAVLVPCAIISRVFSASTGELWGSNGEPVVLGEDEYFVLGDFSLQSMDSRLWETGAAGHPAFAVPKSHMRGVVTHVYWPPECWRILR